MSFGTSSFGTVAFGEPSEVFVHVCFDLDAMQIQNLVPSEGTSMRAIDAIEFDIYGAPTHFTVTAEYDAGGGTIVEDVCYRNRDGTPDFVGFYKNSRSVASDNGDGSVHIKLYRTGGWRTSPTIYALASENGITLGLH